MALAVAFTDIEAAQRTIRGKVLRTPTIPAPRLSEWTGAEIFVKYENMQATASFKDRGALVRLMSLTPEARAKGVVAMSAGNHAQAVAFHARRLAIPATIVMPVGTPFVKVGKTERFGAEVVLAGETLFEARAKAEEIARERGLTMVHPYDDPKVIAGQGTAGLEILRDAPDLDCLVVPIGGGGLIAGVAVAAKHLKPAIEIYGVQCDAYPAMLCAVRGTVPPAGGMTLAEGIAVKSPGALTIPIVKALVSDILIIGEEAIERAVAAFLTLQKTMA
ncbi:MAG: pyridoxal-phosphate dependent enzyme, partial [Hyphomicrobiaceae bacterium]